jgi:tyrosyl-tRNA synthetase
MLVGRDFLKKIKNKEKAAITVKLLADAHGKKMGKTEGNMVTLADTHIEMFGKIMSWTDGMIVPGFELCTDFSLEQVAEIDRDLKSNVLHPKKAKVLLAKEIVKTYHGEQKAQDAEMSFERTFSKGEVAHEGVIELRIPAHETLGAGLLSAGYIQSISEYRRLVQGGAVSDASGEKITDPKYVPQHESVYKVGKKSFYKVHVV